MELFTQLNTGGQLDFVPPVSVDGWAVGTFIAVMLILIYRVCKK